MKRSTRFLKMLPLLLCLFSCTTSKNNKFIIGNWSGAEWLIDGMPSNLDATGTAFSFNANGEYSYLYSGNKQTGTYKVENDMLFTTPDGQQEMMVKILKLTKDSLIFDMNRGGRPESLTLLRK
ncbi:MAG: lipocalin family protein [Ferruginibacter sp.]|nr:lipocalin family protein [Ferruginibacter sp.]